MPKTHTEETEPNQHANLRTTRVCVSLCTTVT